MSSRTALILVLSAVSLLTSLLHAQDYSPDPIKYPACGPLSKCITRNDIGRAMRRSVARFCRGLLVSKTGVSKCEKQTEKCRYFRRSGLKKPTKLCRTIIRKGYRCNCPVASITPAASPSLSISASPTISSSPSASASMSSSASPTQSSSSSPSATTSPSTSSSSSSDLCLYFWLSGYTPTTFAELESATETCPKPVEFVINRLEVSAPLCTYTCPGDSTLRYYIGSMIFQVNGGLSSAQARPCLSAYVKSRFLTYHTIQECSALTSANTIFVASEFGETGGEDASNTDVCPANVQFGLAFVLPRPDYLPGGPVTDNCVA